ncbi:efflux RND transporter permease subunit [Thiohalophilus sp.]|uniref:efflux RND transporter permease subunit n=1 Tax=Thiohalophilus sp. TaxID=3028392 RepID=UPI002ACE5105|nr:efflux RND transporter permease subunit [Thiohalophilus sp.]MDZ7661148.1 efflux RND transporter permease subunit [Thiohalophilus sp.]
MILADASVRRPVFTSMVALAIIIIGLVSMTRLQIDLLPSVELPTLNVRAQYENASPEVMERMVTQILEEIVATVPGVEEIVSQSSEGTANVRVSFSWDTDINVAASDMRARLDDERSELPDEVTGLRVRKYDIDSFPVVLMGVSSDIDPVELTRIIEDHIRHRFTRIPGVAQVDPWGGFNREVRVALDPDRINALQLPMNQILAALRDANLDLPAGNLDQGRYQMTLRVPAEFASLDQIRDTVIVRREDGFVTIGQIARVVDTYAKQDRIIRINGKQGVRLAVRKQSGANTVDVSRRILQEIDSVNRAYPQLKIVPVINQGNFIERSITNVSRSVLYGGALAILVLLFFLRNIRSTAVISVAIPISVIATFALLYFAGLTINLMTLAGLALGVGMMVDSSVVVMENVFRRRQELNEPTPVAAVEGTREVGTAIIASTLTTLVIFLPLVFVEGVTGILFQDLGLVVVFSLLCALLVSLSLVPMMAGRLLAGQSASGTYRSRYAGLNRLIDASGKGLDKLADRYQQILSLALRYRRRSILSAVGLLLGSLLLLPFIGTEFLPPSDEGEVRISGEMEVGTRLDLVDRQTRKMESIVYAAVPEMVSSVASVVTASRRAGGASRGEIRLSLVPATERERSNTEIAQDLRQRLEGKIAGMQIRTRAPQGQFLLERLLAGGEGINVEVRGFDFDTIDQLSKRVAGTVAEVEGITDVEISRRAGIPQLAIDIDRNKAADLGLSPRDVAEVFETAVAGSQAGEYRTEGDSYRILVQIEDVEQRDIEEVLNLALSTPRGEQVTLRNLVTVDFSQGPVIIERKDQERLITVTGNIAGRDLGSVAAAIQTRLDQIPRPRGYELLIVGKFEEQQEAFQQLLISLLLAVLLVYMVLASQYESFRDPLIVMISVPLAAIGVISILFITGTTLNLQSYIGCIMLGGIVVNNAILLVDQAGRLRREGFELQPAVIEAGRRRLRPILMTTLTTILALLPLALGIGEGADAQAPMARAVIGGLTASTLITLVLIPVLYTIVHQRER